MKHFFFVEHLFNILRGEKKWLKKIVPRKKKQSLKIKSKWENVYKSHQVCDCLNGARETG